MRLSHQYKNLIFLQIIFFAPNGITVGYCQQRSAGAGMYNVGNTCYLNSTLQALFHTPALFNFLIENNSHSAKCSGNQSNGFAQVTTLTDIHHALQFQIFESPAHCTVEIGIPNMFSIYMEGNDLGLVVHAHTQYMHAPKCRICDMLF